MTAEAWSLCAPCVACGQRCPQEVEIINIMRSLCRITVGLGVGRVPDSIKVTMENISGVGNPAGYIMGQAAKNQRGRKSLLCKR